MRQQLFILPIHTQLQHHPSTDASSLALFFLLASNYHLDAQRADPCKYRLFLIHKAWQFGK